jgi:hypothetical protein
VAEWADIHGQPGRRRRTRRDRHVGLHSHPFRPAVWRGSPQLCPSSVTLGRIDWRSWLRQQGKWTTRRILRRTRERIGSCRALSLSLPSPISVTS